MALTNIFREPRREITESAIGIAVVGAFIVADYQFALWFQVITGDIHGGCPWPIGLIFGLLAAVVFVGGAVLTHEIGDSICNALDKRGLRLRPVDRW